MLTVTWRERGESISNFLLGANIFRWWLDLFGLGSIKKKGGV